MKAKKIIGATMALVGMTMAVCVADGSSHEILARFAGVALLATGAYIAKLFDFQQKGGVK